MAWITILPLVWLVTITTTASGKNSPAAIRASASSPRQQPVRQAGGWRIAPDKAAVAPQLIFNQQLDALLVLFFVILLWLIVGDTLRICARHLRGKPVPPICETNTYPPGWRSMANETE